MSRIFSFILLNLYSLVLIAQENETLFANSLTSYKNGNYNDALTSISNLIKIDSSKADYYIHRANIYFSIKNYNKTVEDCYKALTLSPGVPEAFFLRGQVCLVTESYGPALLMFNKAMEKYTDNGKIFQTYLYRGKVYSKLGNKEEALKDFLAAYNIAPDSVSLLLPMAETYIGLKKLEEAIVLLEKIKAIDNEFYPVYQVFGNLYFESNNYEKALENYDKYIQLKDDDITVLNRITLASIYLKDYEKARKTVSKSLSVDQKNPVSNKLKGILLIETGLKEEGCDYLFRAFQLGYLNQVGEDIIDIYIKNCEPE